MTVRRQYREGSNNPRNTNKNVCGLMVASVLGVSNTVHYLHTIQDLVRAARTRFTVRSRLSKLGKGKSVGAVRAKMIKMAQEERALGFILRVDGHVLFVDHNGKTVVDTDPRKRDRRKITHAFIVFPKRNHGVFQNATV